MVEVALVEVVLPVMVKFPITVEEAVERKPVVVKRPAESTEKSEAAVEERNFRKVPAKDGVEEATIKSPVVEVAFTWR